MSFSLLLEVLSTRRLYRPFFFLGSIEVSLFLTHRSWHEGLRINAFIGQLFERLRSYRLTDRLIFCG